MKEIWKDISGFEGLYQVSTKGNVRSFDREVIRSDGRIVHYKGKLLKPYLCGTTTKYLSVDLNTKDCKRCTRMVHRLVAETFIPNPENKPEVNHIKPIINGGTNEVENLEWTTKIENIQEATKLGLYKNNHKNVSPEKRKEGLKKARIASAEKLSIPVLMLDKNTEEVLKEFKSIIDACTFLGKSKNAKTDISNVCKGKRLTAYGYKWSYKS